MASYSILQTGKKVPTQTLVWPPSNDTWFKINYWKHKKNVNIKSTTFPNSVIKAWIVNQDGVENHFCQPGACNGQNNTPTYQFERIPVLEETKTIVLRHETSSIKTMDRIS